MKKTLSAGLAALVLLLVFGAASVRATDPVPGWNGDVKIHEGSTEPSPDDQNNPKVCTFHLHAFNFDSQEQVDWWIIKGEPFNTTPVLTGTIATDTDGAYVSGVITLSPDHYKLFWAGEEAGGAKHKVFKVECPTPNPSTEPSVSPSISPYPSASLSPLPSTDPSASPSTEPSESIGPETSLTPTPSVDVDTGGGPDITPPPTDTDGAVSFAATAVGAYLIISGISAIAALLVLLYVFNQFRKPPRFH